MLKRVAFTTGTPRDCRFPVADITSPSDVGLPLSLPHSHAPSWLLQDKITDPYGEKHVERIYCGHIYHHKCLDDYMKTPPFAGKNATTIHIYFLSLSFSSSLPSMASNHCSLHVKLIVLFSGGKKCLSCERRIYHEKWTATPELAEARWAHKQAKQRELDEIIDFMSWYWIYLVYRHIIWCQSKFYIYETTEMSNQYRGAYNTSETVCCILPFPRLIRTSIWAHIASLSKWSWVTVKPHLNP